MQSSKDRDLEVLNYIVHHPNDFADYQDALKTLQFDYAPARQIFPILLRLFGKHNKMPTQSELKWALSQQRGFKEAPVVAQAAIVGLIESVYNQAPTEATGSLIADFIVYKELYAISDGLEENLKAGSHGECLDEYREKLEALELLSSQASTDDILFPFSQDAISNFGSHIEEIAGGDVIPTPFSKYNHRSRGGIFRGDSSIIMGSTNVGKTTALVSLAVGWSLAGYRVIYYAIDSAQDEMWERLYVRAANKPLTEDYNFDDLGEDVGTRVGDNHNLILRFFPAASATPQDVFRDYNKVRGKLGQLTGNDKVDIVIIDYGDQLIPKRGYKEKRHELASIFTDFAGFAQKEKVHVLSATQANRAALSKNVITLENIAEAYSKAAPAANIWALCQSDAEYHDEKFRLAVLKSRRGPKNYLVPMCVKYETQLLYENPDELGVIPIVAGGSSKKQESRKVEPKKSEELQKNLAKAIGIGAKLSNAKSEPESSN